MTDLHFGVPVGRFYEELAARLVSGAERAFGEAGATFEVFDVPGAYELPLAALYLAQTGRFAGVACLGAVIRGETDHYDYVCNEAARGIQDVQLRTGVPCAFGVLTVETMEQALARSGGGHRDTGYHAAEVVLRMAALRAELGVKYDQIGRTYARTRATDPRIAAAIWDALGDARTVVNVGAGTGNYEPPDREVTAVEPSGVMIAQRSPDAAPAVQASAEALPFEDGSFDAAIAVLTIHHWPDWRRGIEELRRVARRLVVFSWDPSFARRLWVTAEYFPFVGDEEGTFPSLADQAGAVRATRVTTVPIPWDCEDGFYGAYWRRPEAYLDPDVRGGISVLAGRTPEELEPGLAALRDDLDSGAWAERHADLLERDELDLGYRLLVA